MAIKLRYIKLYSSKFHIPYMYNMIVCRVKAKNLMQHFHCMYSAFFVICAHSVHVYMDIYRNWKHLNLLRKNNFRTSLSWHTRKVNREMGVHTCTEHIYYNTPSAKFAKYNATCITLSVKHSLQEDLWL